MRGTRHFVNAGWWRLGCGQQQRENRVRCSAPRIPDGLCGARRRGRRRSTAFLQRQRSCTGSSLPQRELPNRNGGRNPAWDALVMCLGSHRLVTAQFSLLSNLSLQKLVTAFGDKTVRKKSAHNGKFRGTFGVQSLAIPCSPGCAAAGAGQGLVTLHSPLQRSL